MILRQLFRFIGSLFLILSLVTQLSGCAAESLPYIRIPVKEPSSAYLKNLHPRVILVLGSGSARGFAHAGVLKVLEQNHIPIDMIIGTSAGSIVGSLYADNPSADHLTKILKAAKRENVIDFSLIRIVSGPISGYALQKFLLTHLHAYRFDQLQIPFLAIASDLTTGRLHVFASGPIAPAVNASSAASPLFQPVALYGHLYVDGGFLDPVAVDVAKSFHPKLIIAVKLDDALSTNMPSTSAGVFLRGFDMMLLQLNQECAHQANVVISPKISGISMFDGAQRIKIMHAGTLAAQAAIPQIKRLLVKYHIPLTK